LASQLRINMAAGVLMTVANILVMMAGYPVYLHFLGYEQYGLWLVLTIVLVVAQLGDFGMGPAVTRLVAQDYGGGDTRGIQQYATMAITLLCLSGSAVLLGVVLFRSWIVAAFRLRSEDAAMVASLIPYVGVLSIYVFVVHVLDATLSGLGRMDQANYIQTGGRIVGLICSTALLYGGIGITGLLIGSTIACVFTHVLDVLCIRRAIPFHLLQMDRWDWERGKCLVRFGGTVFMGNVVAALGSPFNKLMVTRYAGVGLVPAYEIAFTGTMQFRGLIDAALRPLMPEISRLDGITTLGATNRMRQVCRRAMRIILFAGVPAYIGLILLSPVLLQVWLGNRFTQSLPGVFRIMLVASFLSLVAVPSYYSLMGLGHARDILFARSITWIVNMVSVTMVAMGTGRLSLTVIGGCLVVSWTLSSIYLIRRLWCVLRERTEKMPGSGGIRTFPLAHAETISN